MSYFTSRSLYSALAVLLLPACTAFEPLPNVEDPLNIEQARIQARDRVEQKKPGLRGLPEPRIQVQIVDLPDRCPAHTGGCAWFSRTTRSYHIQIHSRCSHGYLIAVHEFMHVYLSHERQDGDEPISLHRSQGEQDHRWMETHGFWNGLGLKCPK